MIARRSFLVALAGLASSSASSDDESAADIFVFAGQSNIQVNANTTLQNVPDHIARDVGVQIWHILDRKSTRLNSSHQIISYAVFCLKKKTIKKELDYEFCRPRTLKKLALQVLCIL